MWRKFRGCPLALQAICLLALLGAGPDLARAGSKESKPMLTQNWLRTQLSFEATGLSSQDFAAHGQGYSIRINSQGAEVLLCRSGSPPETARFRIRLVGARPNVRTV